MQALSAILLFVFFFGAIAVGVWAFRNPGEVLPANIGYLLSPDCIHESMIFDQPTERQFLRIAFAI